MTGKHLILPTGRLLAAKSDAENLKSAANKLADRSLYRATGKDDEGNDVYKRDDITKNVKEFVSAYNSYIDSSSNVLSNNILNKALGAVKQTSANKKLSEAKMSTLTSLFTGSGSYGSGIGQKASETYRLANSATYSANNRSSYNYGGSYSVMGTSNNSWDKYF